MPCALSFIQAHAAHPDWREALTQCAARVREQVSALTKAFPDLADLPVPVQAAGVPAEWAAVLWSVEELRISYFAQHLPTAHPVSDTRIHKALAAL